MVSNMHSCHSTETMPWLVILTYWPIHFTTVPLRLTEIFLQSTDSKTWEGSRCRHHVEFSKCAKKRPAIHPLARPKPRSFCTFRNLSFDRSTTEDKPLYLTSFTGKKLSQSQGKGHCQLLPKDWKTASHALTGDPLAPQQPPVAMGRHYAYAPMAPFTPCPRGAMWWRFFSIFGTFFLAFLLVWHHWNLAWSKPGESPFYTCLNDHWAVFGCGDRTRQSRRFRRSQRRVFRGSYQPVFNSSSRKLTELL